MRVGHWLHPHNFGGITVSNWCSQRNFMKYPGEEIMSFLDTLLAIPIIAIVIWVTLVVFAKRH